jgi:hypothetical protein
MGERQLAGNGEWGSTARSAGRVAVENERKVNDE